MVGFAQKHSASPRDAADSEVPAALAQALNASAADLHEGRILDNFDSFIDEMEAELEAHLRQKQRSEAPLKGGVGQRDQWDLTAVA